MITCLRDQLKRDEGERLFVYPDSKGIRTAGVGYNLPAHGITNLKVGDVITQAQSDAWLDQSIAETNSLLWNHIPWISGIDAVRQGVLMNMCFNMGWGDRKKHGLSSLKIFLGLVQQLHYGDASLAILRTKWATDVGDYAPDQHRPLGGRAWRLSMQTRTGVWV